MSGFLFTWKSYWKLFDNILFDHKFSNINYLKTNETFQFSLKGLIFEESVILYSIRLKT